LPASIGRKLVGLTERSQKPGGGGKLSLAEEGDMGLSLRLPMAM
jgi:hypothetical protein